MVDVDPALGVDVGVPLGDHPGDLEGVVARRHHGRVALEQLGDGPVGVDREVVDDRLHRERQGVVELGLDPSHDLQRLGPEGVAAIRGDEEGHAAAGHAAEHQEAPEVVAEVGLRLGDDRLGEAVGDPGDDPLERPVPVLRRQAAERPDVGRADGLDDLIEDAEGLLAGLPTPPRRGAGTSP